MRERLRKPIILLNLAVILLIVGVETFKKERLRETGELVLFTLAPVDPRSLMQGDYMQLAYDITRSNFTEELSSSGYIVFSLDENKVATFIRFQNELEPTAGNERKIKYHRHESEISFGAEEFFFQEGAGPIFANAKFGALRIDSKGNGILVGVFDKDHNEIRQ
ncbi:GDYXXLXY protein [Leptospira fainei serovar Hurstbridge str. BUT 6]|uniref:GDYXXLXY protein n=1 Tax=Leptospira fainei serovar Hurstbridge str. BUT 6 TaxID=1193011 RepID=S3V8T8_9LEPT|nr:GDYXXLXY domain-containing protein [Leptospira fainei]EPG72845.1 GDYXXLXY protein [Leptospira fainei serovar Hurstbridge str. BUT 6]